MEALTVITIVSSPGKYRVWRLCFIDHFLQHQLFSPLILAMSLFSTQQRFLVFTRSLAGLSKTLILLHFCSKVAAESTDHVRECVNQGLGDYLDIREYLQVCQIPSFCHSVIHQEICWQVKASTSLCGLNSPDIILLSSVLCAGSVVVFYYIHRHDRYQGHLLLWITLPFGISGVLFAKDPADFVFRYLFWGLNVALICSALIHRYLNWRKDLSVRDVIQETEQKSAW